MMTRKDYVETADILAGVRPALESLGLAGEQIFSDLANDFAEMFANDNDRFQSGRFFDACWER
jgi:hypothetical protein